MVWNQLFLLTKKPALPKPPKAPNIRANAIVTCLGGGEGKPPWFHDGCGSNLWFFSTLLMVPQRGLESNLCFCLFKVMKIHEVVIWFEYIWVWTAFNCLFAQTPKCEISLEVLWRVFGCCMAFCDFYACASRVEKCPNPIPFSLGTHYQPISIPTILCVCQQFDANWPLLNSLLDMDVSKNNGTPKSSILIGFSIINHPFWGTPIFGNTHMLFTPLPTSNKKPRRLSAPCHIFHPSNATSSYHWGHVGMCQ